MARHPLIDTYASEHHPIDSPDPIEAIKLRMEQEHLTRKDLEGILGTRTGVAEVLNRRRSRYRLSVSRLKTLSLRAEGEAIEQPGDAAMGLLRRSRSSQ